MADAIQSLHTEKILGKGLRISVIRLILLSLVKRGQTNQLNAVLYLFHEKNNSKVARLQKGR